MGGRSPCKPTETCSAFCGYSILMSSQEAESENPWALQEGLKPKRRGQLSQAPPSPLPAANPAAGPPWASVCSSDKGICNPQRQCPGQLLFHSESHRTEGPSRAGVASRLLRKAGSWMDHICGPWRPRKLPGDWPQGHSASFLMTQPPLGAATIGPLAGRPQAETHRRLVTGSLGILWR